MKKYSERHTVPITARWGTCYNTKARMDLRSWTYSSVYTANTARALPIHHLISLCRCSPISPMGKKPPRFKAINQSLCA